MSHSTERIYTDSSYGISISDIRAVLRSNRNDIGGIITNSTINKWSRNKPVRSATLGIASMSAANYGIDIAANGYSSLPAVVTAINGGYAWDYLKPRGASYSPKEWFRFLDFNGYYNSAVAPLRFMQNTQTTVYDGATTATVTVPFYKTAETDTESVTLGILKPYGGSLFSTMYFGVLLYCESPALYFARTMSAPLSSVANADEIAVELTGVSAPNAGTRTYTAIPFFCTQPITTTISGTNSIQAGTIFPIPIVTCEVNITQVAVTSTSYVFAYTNPNETSPLYYRLNINTNVSLQGVQYQIIACKNASGVSSPDDVVLVSSTISTSDLGNIYIPSETGWSSVNNTGFYPLVIEANGYTNIRCEMRRGEVQVGTHSALSISWGTGSEPFDNI